MRKILFRGIRVDGGGWVEGYLVFDEDGRDPEIFTGRYHSNDQQPYEIFSVKPETICQYTGLDDKNGNMIFNDSTVSCNSVEYIVSQHKIGTYELRRKDGTGDMLFLFKHHEAVTVSGSIHDTDSSGEE